MIDERHANAGVPIAVRMRGLTKRYPNGTLAIDMLDLTVHKGEFVSLLGPSGCGKSTALYILAGLATATTGGIELAGCRQQDGSGGSVGFVFQEPSLMPWATVAENVALPLALNGYTAASATEVGRCLAMVGLDGFAAAYPRELSGGMKMRVSIARALVTRPQLFLLDEPFGALDEITRTKLHDDLLKIWAETGCTVIMVTHSITESVYLSNRVVVMASRPGRVSGSVEIREPHPRGKVFRLSSSFATAIEQVSLLFDEVASESAV